ncbi:MAG: FAD-binding oxidoreductase [Planctomycetes bacterium]|nr:FAD-binding oxidoreductase [Planctomycetota bacterium]
MPATTTLAPTCDHLVAGCRALLGADRVAADPETLTRWARTTLPQGTRALAVAAPRSTAQVQAVVRLAAAAGTPVHPVSRGRNWGYGDACAPRPEALLLDLAGMDRIRALDLELGTATVEPGVSQGRLAAALAEAGGGWIADCTGAGPDASIIGNLAERGFGHSAHGDRFAHACAFEVVLADGSVIETGFAGLPGARAATVYKWGVGPALDGIFTQSNLGIITRATVWLMPRPRRQAMVVMASPCAGGIAALVEGLRRLRLEGVVDGTVHLFNRMRLLGAVAPFPYERCDGSTAIDASHPALVDELAARHRLPHWVACTAIGGEPGVVRARLAAARAGLRAAGCDGLVLTCTPARLAAARAAAALCPGWAGGSALRAQVGKLDLLWRLSWGTPDATSLVGGGWRVRHPIPGARDPREAGAGMMWVSPVLPASAAAVAEVEQLGREVLHRHGFEHQVTYSFVNPRALCGVISICFDQGDASQRSRAVTCHDHLVERLARAGFAPYRASPPTAELLWRHQVAPWDLLRRLGQALDPAGILSPGRYLPLRPSV